MKRILAAALSLTMATSITSSAQRVNVDGAMQTFDVFSNEYFDGAYKFAPTWATQLGLHEYDSQLEDYSAASIAKQVAYLKEWEGKIASIPADGLDRSYKADQQMLLNSIHSQLLSLETIRMWERNPDSYSSGVTGSIFVIMSRNYAPVNMRLRAAVEREKQIPQVFVEAKKNLKAPPEIYTEIALEQIDGLVSFFENDVPLAFKDATDASTKADFTKSNAAVIAALKDYGAWMKSDLLPRSNGNFAFGADTYRKKLLYDEMVDTPLDKLIEIDLADMHKNQAEFARIAKEVDPTKTPMQVLAELQSIYPDPNKLLDAFRDSFTSEINFIRTHHIVTIPSDVRPTLEETPPFMRATTQASMDSPGPFERNSKTAFFNVTLPEKDWSAARIKEHMAAFNIGTIVSTSVHEAYPGHYIQFLYAPMFPSKVRKLTGSNSNIEGWAHYCEQMMLDEGYGQPGWGVKDEREAKLVRLGQLQDALLRNARFYVGIKMHTEGMSMDDAIAFFQKEGYQSHSIAEMETKRGTSDATYLYYTLGKLMIMKLRADVKAKEGAKFSLQQFHDDLMKQGPISIKLIREAMLHDGSPVL